MSANAFYRQLQSLGLAARRSEVLALYREAKEIVSAAPEQVFENPDLAPDPTSLKIWPTSKATGVKQTVTLTYRDRTTGEISKTFYSVTSPDGIARSEAVDEAIGAYSDASERYNQDLIGAIHTSAYRLTPTGV
jgi:hypothetical protein